MSNKPKRTTFRSRLDEMVASVRRDIAMGRYEPGDYLPSEQQLSELFHLSKNSVRKGLDKLVMERLIEKVPRVGTRVIRLQAYAPVTLRLGYHSTMVEQANLMALIERFHQTHPHITVKPVPLPDLRLAYELADYMNHEPVDVLTVNNPLFEQLSELGPIDDYLEPLEPAEGTYSFLFRPFTARDALYVQPFVFSPLILCYNEAHFREAGVPVPSIGWTWDDVSGAARRLSESSGQLGFYVHLPSLNRWPLFLLQQRLSFSRQPDGRLEFDRSRLETAASLRASLMAENDGKSIYLSERDSDAERLFLQQKASMVVTSYFGLNDFQNTAVEYDIAPLPSSGEAATLLIAIGFGVHSRSKHKQEAKAFVRFCLSEESQLALRRTTTSVPALQRAAEWSGAEGSRRPAHYFLYRELVSTFRLYADMNISYRELEAIGEQLKLYWAGLESFEAVCARIEAAGTESAG
ncbi:MAG: extracellular solute-binding protein [Paenibacillus sp.]|nr:extracellular solute-binding protein [Paenibacillus sp.]